MKFKLSDKELVEALLERLEFNREALDGFRSANRQLERTNQKLQESEAVRSHFLSNIRNEINNPLTSILALSSQFLTGQIECEKTIAFAGMVHAEASNLDFQLQNIFVAAELEAGEGLPAYSMVDIGGVVDSIFDRFCHRAVAKNIELKNTVAEGFMFTTDIQKFQLMLMNLCANALEFSLESGTVTVSAQLADGDLYVSVRDDGIGIAREEQELIFDRFKQLDAGSTKQHQGHGLGLSVTKALTEILDGTVTISSAAGEGCTVTLCLPEPMVEAVDLARDGNLFLFEGAEQL